MPTVVIAYGGREDTPHETKFLEDAGYQVRYLPGLPEPGPVLADADALLVTVQPVTAPLLDAMPRCRVIGRVGTGLDAIDVAAATERGVYVTNVSDYSIDEVSTHAITLLLAHLRRLPAYLDIVRRGGWSSTGAGVIPRASGLTLGVVGFGRIGQATAAKARGLGLRVLATDPVQSAEAMAAAGVQARDWAGLLGEADYVSLHVPLTPQTTQLIGAEALRAMKPTGVLINTARGGLVDEIALADAVRAGTIGGALLDVLTEEPPPPDHPLLHDERIWVTPHTAWYSADSQRDVAVRACEDVQLVLTGRPPRSPANDPATRQEQPR